MKTALFAPFGAMNLEAGVMHLLLRYMDQLSSARQVLQCNGMFSLCDRDGAENWKRSMMGCAGCMHDQSELARWSGGELVPLSKFLSPDVVRDTARWSKQLRIEALPSALHAGNNIFDLCRGSFSKRFDTLEPDLANKHHVGFLKRLMLGAVRSGVIAREYLRSEKPDLLFIAGAQDFISQSYYLEARRRDIRAVRFSWDSGSRNVRIFHPESGQACSCPFLLEDLDAVRGDISTWPEELVEMLDEILLFLEITDIQLHLPIAQ